MRDTVPAIEVRGLEKRFGDTRAVAGLDLVVRRGSIYGLLGPNGAGKTTTVRVLATLLKPDAGEAFVLGHALVREAVAIRRRIALTGQFASVDEDLTARENLLLLSRLSGLTRREARERAASLLDAFDLSGAAERQAKSLSGGMRRRLDIAASLIVTPDLLFLDEPTTGLDPRSRQRVWEIVRALVAAGTTVLLTTQYLEEADQLAERIAVIDHGRVIAEGTSQELKASVGSSMLHIGLADPADREAARRLLADRLGETASEGVDPAALSVKLSDPGLAPAALAGLSAAGIRLSDFSLGQPSLDEVFFALTGHGAGTGDEETPR